MLRFEVKNNSAISFDLNSAPRLDMSVGKASIVHGEDGKSAYQIAVDNGFEGTEKEWLDSLKGDPFTYEDFTSEQLEALTGPAGKDGYTPQKGVDYFDGQDGKDGTDGYTPVKGVDYFDGKDGYTPVKGVDYFDGTDGKDGANGKDGVDGYTPVKGVDYFDGTDGKDGKDGADGYTPVKGTDYWTPTDKQEIVSDVLAALPVYNGEVESV